MKDQPQLQQRLWNINLALLTPKMTFSTQVTIKPNSPRPATRKVEKWSQMVEQVERTFDYMLNWNVEEYWADSRLQTLQSYGRDYQTEIERFNRNGLYEAERLENLEIRDDPRETLARRNEAARALDYSKFLEGLIIEAEVEMRKHILRMIYAERELEVRRGLENY